MAVSLSIVEFIKRISIESFAITVTAKNDARERDFNICFTLTLLACVGVATILFVSSELIAALLHSPQIATALRYVSGLLITLGLSRTHEAWLARHMMFKVLAIRSLVSVALGGATAIAMAIGGFGIWSLVGQQLVTGISALALLWATTPWRPKLLFDREGMLENIRYARFVSITGMWSFMSAEADIFFVSTFLGSFVAGLYNAAKRIMMAANHFMTNAINRVAISAFATLKSDEERANMLLSGVAMVSLITAPAFAGLAVLAPEIVSILLGPSWSQTTPILACLAASGYALSLGQFNSVVFMVSGKPNYDSGYTFIAAIANIILFLIAVRYGVIALALSFTVRLFLLAPLSTHSALRILGIKGVTYIWRVLPSCLAAITMALIVQYIITLVPHWPVLIRLMVGAGFGAMIYLVFVWCVDRANLIKLMTLVYHTMVASK